MSREAEVKIGRHTPLWLIRKPPPIWERFLSFSEEIISTEQHRDPCSLTAVIPQFPRGQETAGGVFDLKTERFLLSAVLLFGKGRNCNLQ